MKVCDRCKKEMNTNAESKLGTQKFELCLECIEYISNHIKTYQKPKGLLGGFGSG